MKRSIYNAKFDLAAAQTAMAKQLFFQHKNVVVQTISEEVLVYNLSNHKAHCLNKTAAMIREACDGKSDILKIKSNVDQNSGEQLPLDLIILTIDDLITKDLIVRQDHGSIDRTTRREMIRKAALTTAIALPLISSVVSPAAVSAQSCIGFGTGAPGTPVNAFTDNGGCEFFLNDMCCSGAVTNYEFTLCCSEPQQEGIGTCTGTCA